MIDLGILYAVKEGDFIRRLGFPASMQEIAAESGKYILSDLENSCIVGSSSILRNLKSINLVIVASHRIHPGYRLLLEKP